MNLALVEQAIRDRLDADTGTGGMNHATAPLVNDYQAEVMTAPREPYVLFRCELEDEDDTFDNDAANVTVEFEVVTRRQDDRYAKASSILARLKGDGMTQASRVPTYGFHRWTPTISGYEATSLRRVAAVTNHTPDEYRHIEQYTFRVSEDFTG